MAFIVAATGIGVGTAVGACSKLMDRYPSSFKEKAAKSVVEVDGQERVVLGYTGHHAGTFATIAQAKRDLYFGGAATAMNYALRNGAATASQAAAPVIGMVVADRAVSYDNPSDSDCAVAFKPLTPEQQKALNVKVVNLTPVTLANREGVAASWQRMQADIKARGLKPVLAGFMPAPIASALFAAAKQPLEK
jgi:hypothetical protein